MYVIVYALGLVALKEIPFLLPDVGEGIQTVQVVEWWVSMGLFMKKYTIINFCHLRV